MEKRNIDEVLKKYEEVVQSDRILSAIKPGWTNLEKALYVYIELEKKLKSVDSKDVAAIYKAIMDRLEIPCKYVNGVKNNAWNELEIDSTYYPMDLAWDCDYHHSAESQGNIGICRFLVDKSFYQNPNHLTEEVDIKERDKIRALDSKLVEKALNTINSREQVEEITQTPDIDLKSKEMKGIFEGDRLTEKNTHEIKEIKISLSDNNTDELKSDIKQIARFYPQLLRNVEIENITTSKLNMQEVVDEIYKAKKSLAKTQETYYPMNITITSSRAEDFDLDFSNAPTVNVNKNGPVDSSLPTQNITLKNTSGSTLDFPNIVSKISQNITGLTIDGFDVGNLDLTNTQISKIAFKSDLTRNINGITGLGGVGIVEIESITDTEFENFMSTIYSSNPNIFDLAIRNQNLHDRRILDELASNSNLVRLEIQRSRLNKLDGLEKFNGRLGLLALWGNDITVDDVKVLNEFRENTPFVELYCESNQKVRNTITSVEANISPETVDFIRNQLKSSGDEADRNLSRTVDVIDCLYREVGPNIPYYIKDARVMREILNITNNPMMLENDNEINTIDFSQSYLNNGKLLLTIPQLELLLQSGKTIPQKVILKIESVADLDSTTLKDFNMRARGRGINLTGIQIFDKNTDNYCNGIVPYSLSEYVYIRDTLDTVVEGIDPNESDLDKFTTVYLRLADSIVYDHPATKCANKSEALYYAKESNSARNLLNGLKDGKCVCAGYADILRNALDLVGVESRLNRGCCDRNNKRNTGHAWNQVKIDGKWYYTDLTWDRQKDDTRGERKNFDNMLKGENSFRTKHQVTETQNIETVEQEGFDRVELKAAIDRAKKRSFDFTQNTAPINIPNDPQMTIQIDDDRIREEFRRRTDDMLAKYYGNKEYQREYELRSARFREHEIETNQNGLTYRTIDDYAEREEDEQFLLLDKYKECLERVTKYEAGDTSVYQGTQDQINAQLQEDREYIETRNHTFNQHEHTQKDLATMGKFGERVPYIPPQQGIIRNIGRALGNTSIFVRNIFTPVYRGVGRYIAQPIHRLVTRGNDASPYRNNIYHRMIARRNYFLEQAQHRDEIETQNRINAAIDPSTVHPVRHPIRNYFSSRMNAVFRARIGNEAVLRAGAADIKENIKEQEGQRAIISTLEHQIQEYRNQINLLNQELASNPRTRNKKEVLDAVKNKSAKMATLEQRLSKMSIDANAQTDAISSDQHAIASKEVNTLRTTVIKGFAKGLAVKYVGPKIETWLLEHGKQVKTYAEPSQEFQETQVWVPSTYKEKVTDVYDNVLDTSKNMKDIISVNKGKDITGFYSVYGGEKNAAIYQITGDEKITAVFQAVGKGGNGLADKVGMQAPTITDGTFGAGLLDSTGLLKQDITIEQLLSGLKTGTIDSNSLENVYVSIGDKYWTKLSDLTGDLVKEVKVDEISQQVIDVAGHYETVRDVVYGTNIVTKYVTKPTLTKAVNIGENIAKGGVGVDSIIDLVENIRPTSTDVKPNKKNPRQYEYDDIDMGDIPASKRDYHRNVEQDEGR